MSRRDEGQSTVELTLALPLLAFLLLGIIQVGLVVRGQVLVTHAAREAARTAAVGESDADVRRSASGSGGLLPHRMKVQIDEAGDRVEVRVKYNHPTSVPIVGALLGDVTLSSTATMRIEDG